ncbi:MAG: hypothetical protein FWC16_02010 [Defluviitaleaceae bacterium]|nr:hypothetical protein [Defluviitaleaceae bacterium]MCL2273674.1 hypothetical protein [Defluviitaleaceae bacterium]
MTQQIHNQFTELLEDTLAPYKQGLLLPAELLNYGYDIADISQPNNPRATKPFIHVLDHPFDEDASGSLFTVQVYWSLTNPIPNGRAPQYELQQGETDLENFISRVEQLPALTEYFEEALFEFQHALNYAVNKLVNDWRNFFDVDELTASSDKGTTCKFILTIPYETEEFNEILTGFTQLLALRHSLTHAEHTIYELYNPEEEAGEAPSIEAEPVINEAPPVYKVDYAQLSMGEAYKQYLCIANNTLETYGDYLRLKTYDDMMYPTTFYQFGSPSNEDTYTRLMEINHSSNTRDSNKFEVIIKWDRSDSGLRLYSHKAQPIEGNIDYVQFEAAMNNPPIDIQLREDYFRKKYVDFSNALYCEAIRVLSSYISSVDANNHMFTGNFPYDGAFEDALTDINYIFMLRKFLVDAQVKFRWALNTFPTSEGRFVRRVTVKK